MKQLLLLGALLTGIASLNAQAQVANQNNASTIGSSVTSNPDSIGNDRIDHRTGASRKGRKIGATVDGTNGSATNDGASGQSGAPAPLPSFSTKPAATKSTSGQKMKKSPGKQSQTSNSSRD